MNWLSPFFAPASLLELAVVAAVFVGLRTRVKLQNGKLETLIQSLQSEQTSVRKAKSALEQARVAGENAATRNARWTAILKKDAALERVQLVASGGEQSFDTVPQPLRATRNQTRQLQNACVLVGLIGALVCLLFATIHLTITVGRNPKDTVALVRAVCSGVGAALLCTAVGVGFRLWLTERVNVIERNCDELYEAIETFVQLEIAPLTAQNAVDSPRLDVTVARMETVASAFNQALETTLVGLRESHASAAKLREANDAATNQLEKSATNLDKSSGAFVGAAGTLAGNLETLQKTLNAHGEVLGHSTREWNKIGVTSMDLLRGATERAAQTFLDLGELRADILKEIGETQNLAREMHDSALTLGQNIERANTSALSRLQEEVGRGLVGVGDAVEQGVESQAQLLQQFRAVLETMGEYAMRVEETISQLPASMGTEPLLLLDNTQDAGLNLISEGIGHLRAEIAALREAITRDLPVALSDATNNNLANVNQNVAALRDEVRADLAASQKRDNDVAGLSAQINNLNAQVTQLRTNSERGIVIPLPRGK